MAKYKKPSLPTVRSTEYEIGYTKPPEHTRFQPGQSGNPRGRPKGSKNRMFGTKSERLKAIILDEAYRVIPVRAGEKTMNLPVITAVTRTMATKALKGDTRSLKNFTELVGLVEAEEAAKKYALTERMIEYKLGWEAELDRRRLAGITHLPDPVPHPDDIIVDMYNDEVKVVGPMMREDIPKWEMAREHVRKLEQLIEDFEHKALENPRNKDFARTLSQLRAKLDEYRQYIGPGRNQGTQES